MVSRFVALPVGRGDSFYLERDGRTALFDGGQALYSLPGLITRYTNCNKLDVVVCSHNDADHAKGLIGLLDNPSISISEVWLPGRWMEGIHRIANESEQFLREVFEGSSEQQKLSLEKLSEELPDDGHRMGEDPESLGSEDTLISDLEKIEEEIYPKMSYPFFFHLCPLRPLLLVEALDAADRIVKIATKARQRGCKIRWFNFKKFQENGKTQGGEDWLRPLNSVEITNFKRTKISALGFLALTVANKESLTFYSALEGEPSVVFSADSDLAGVKFPALQNAIVTAPHHGADSNKSVYGLTGLNTSIWVRSDMRSSKRPCSNFIGAQQAKFCTRCRNKKGFKQHIEFRSSQGIWNNISGTVPCSC